MAWDIVMSAINNSQFNEAKKLFQFCKQHSVFSQIEINTLKNYLLMRKLKMYKIKPINNYYFNKASTITFEPVFTIGKIAYNKAVLV